MSTSSLKEAEGPQRPHRKIKPRKRTRQARKASTLQDRTETPERVDGKTTDTKLQQPPSSSADILSHEDLRKRRYMSKSRKRGPPSASVKTKEPHKRPRLSAIGPKQPSIPLAATTKVVAEVVAPVSRRSRQRSRRSKAVSDLPAASPPLTGTLTNGTVANHVNPTDPIANGTVNDGGKTNGAPTNGASVKSAPRRRRLPNIAVSGTPGTGKTTLAKRLVAKLQAQDPAFYYLDFAGCEDAKRFREKYDQARQSWIIDDEGLAEHLTPKLVAEGGAVIDWIHVVQFGSAPEGPMDLVVTVQVPDTRILFDRLKARVYSESKVSENMDAEIMNEIVDENERSFGGACTTVLEVKGEAEKDLKRATKLVTKWVQAWRSVNGHGAPEIDFEKIVRSTRRDDEGKVKEVWEVQVEF